MKISLPARPLMLPCPVLVVGAYNADGQPNIMTASWGGVACSQPPYIYVSLREATLSHHNIRQSGAFTVNFPSERYVMQADFAGLVSGRECDKFAQAGLTAEASRRVNAPLVKEFPCALECRLAQQIELGSHTMFIGEVLGIVADEEVGNPERRNFPDVEKVRPILYGSFGSPAYYGIGARLAEAFEVGKELIKGE